MSSATAPVKEIDYGFHAPNVSQVLYNGNEKRIAFDCDGETYVLPSRHEECPEELWAGEKPDGVDVRGRLPLRDRPEIVVGKVGRGGGDPDQGTFQLTAVAVALHAVGENGTTGSIGVRGVRRLSWNEKLNERIIADSQKKSKEAEYRRCLLLKRTHEMANQASIRNGGGVLAPSPESIEAMNYVAQVDAGKFGPAPSLKYQCQSCGMPNSDQFELNAHIGIHHPAEAQQKGIQAADQAFRTELEAVRPTVSLEDYTALKAQVDQLTELLIAKDEPAKPKRGRKKVSDVR